MSWVGVPRLRLPLLSGPSPGKVRERANEFAQGPLHVDAVRYNRHRGGIPTQQFRCLGHGLQPKATPVFRVVQKVLPAEARSLASLWFDFTMHEVHYSGGVDPGTESMDKYPRCSFEESSKLVLTSRRSPCFDTLPLPRRRPLSVPRKRVLRPALVGLCQDSLQASEPLVCIS